MRRIELLFLLFALLPGCAHTTTTTTPAPCPEPQPASELSPAVVSTLRQAGIDPDQVHCNSRVEYGTNLYPYGQQAADAIAEAWNLQIDKMKRHQGARVVLGWLVRAKFETHGNENFGALSLAGHSWQENGVTRPLLVFRSSVLLTAGKPDGCLQSLLDHAGVKHVVNLYAGEFPVYEYIAEEQRQAAKRGVSFHNEAEMNRPWRKIIEKPEDYKKNFALAAQRVAELINSQILRPDGKPPVGNILIHCGGGMHRTGMVVGILERCINQRPLDEIEAEFKVHTAYESEERPGGFEPLNVQFIRDFDCALLAR